MNDFSSDMAMSYAYLNQQTMSSSSPLYEYSVKNNNNQNHDSQVGQQTPNSEISCTEYQQNTSPLEYTVDQTMSDVTSKMTLSARSLTRLQHRTMNENIIKW